MIYNEYSWKPLAGQGWTTLHSFDQFIKAVSCLACLCVQIQYITHWMCCRSKINNTHTMEIMAFFEAVSGREQRRISSQCSHHHDVISLLYRKLVHKGAIRAQNTAARAGELITFCTRIIR